MICNRTKCLAVARSCAVLHLRRAARAVTSRYEDEMRPLGLKATQFSLLVAAALRGPINVSQLAELMVMDRTTLTRNLKPLQKQGLLQVVPGRDRRTRVVTLTAAGEKMLEQALPLWERAQHTVVEGLGQERFAGLLGDLQQTVDVARNGGV
jgi:DNA-binding MarR family transcriptional regulator